MCLSWLTNYLFKNKYISTNKHYYFHADFVECVVKVMKISPQSKFHWQDLEPLLEFIGRIQSLIKRFHAGFMMASCVPLVHTLNRMNCTNEKILVQNLLCYISFRKLYVHKVLQLFYWSCNRYCPLQLFLNCCPLLVQ